MPFSGSPVARNRKVDALLWKKKNTYKNIFKFLKKGRMEGKVLQSS